MTKDSGMVTDKTYQDIVGALSEALIFADRKGIIQAWNHGAEAIFGYSAAEAVGQSLDLIIPEGMRKPHWDGYHRAIAHGATRHAGGSMITRSLRKDGQRLYIDVSFAIIKKQSGETLGSAAVARDATERYLLEKSRQSKEAQPTATPKKPLQSYSAPGITVNFDPNLCYHSAICLKSLPAVFDVARKRWVRPEAASVDEVIATVNKCPSGALTYLREGQAETVDSAEEQAVGATIQPSIDGPLLVQGKFTLTDEAGTTIGMPGRAALCRCGATGNQPFCDNSHQRIGFKSKPYTPV